MRSLANPFFLLLIALFGFGFLMDHSINLSRELTEARDQLTRMQSEMQSLQAQYQAILGERNQLTEQVSRLTNENSALQARIQSLDSERLALSAQIEILQNQLNLAKKANPLLARLIAFPKRGLAAALILVPMLPLSLGAVYVMTHPKKTDRPVTQADRTAGQESFQATLTREELHFIARRRRSHSGRGPRGNMLPG